MKTRHSIFPRLIQAAGALGAVACVGSLASLASCKDPIAPAITTGTGSASGSIPSRVGQVNEDCPAGDDWLPADGGITPPIPMFTPPPHPDSECSFYRGAYQAFLAAMAPLPNGDPGIVNY